MIRLEIALSAQRRARLDLPDALTEAEIARLEALIARIRAAVLIEPPDTPPPDTD